MKIVIWGALILFVSCCVLLILSCNTTSPITATASIEPKESSSPSISSTPTSQPASINASVTPANPNLIGEIKIQGLEVYIDTGTVGNVNGTTYLFLATSEPGLLVYDLSNPLNPTEIAHLKSQRQYNPVHQLEFANGILYGIAGPLWIIDVTNPSKPKEMPSPTYSPSCIAVSGKFAYFTGVAGGISVADISNPIIPQVVNNIKFQDIPYVGVYKIKAVGSLLFCFVGSPQFSSQNGLAILDTRSLNQIGYFPNPGQDSYITEFGRSMPDFTGFNDMAISGEYVYIASEIYGMRVIDISHPSEPIQVIDFNNLRGNPNSNGFEHANNIFISGNIVYLVTESGVYIIDISTPSKPKEIRTFDLPLPFDPVSGISRGFAGFAINNDILYGYANSHPSVIRIIDISPAGR